MTATPHPMRCTNRQRLSVPRLKIVWYTNCLHAHTSQAPTDESISQPQVPAALGPHTITVLPPNLHLHTIIQPHVKSLQPQALLQARLWLWLTRWQSLGVGARGWCISAASARFTTWTVVILRTGAHLDSFSLQSTRRTKQDCVSHRVGSATLAWFLIASIRTTRIPTRKAGFPACMMTSCGRYHTSSTPTNALGKLSSMPWA
jgi:hypothetical protein